METPQRKTRTFYGAGFSCKDIPKLVGGISVDRAVCLANNRSFPEATLGRVSLLLFVVFHSVQSPSLKEHLFVAKNQLITGFRGIFNGKNYHFYAPYNRK